MTRINLSKLPPETEKKVLEEQKKTGQSLASIARLALVERYQKKG
jgi:hypothetical protein